ncbi:MULTISPECIES: 4a-hydroxytetrahydrobiopterin dehydratase [Prauserella salsuginis group]|uniref:Putative pterin-4-alpha-carbinolamine dehydratase n=1 Tax=Prauserella salsuginis TaxID=387889 RepID=A0ABW6G0E7_9PSEU|nr:MULTISPECIES: 4a-hydroxytetrahydrobiopterin dehydratase [Prauserella salsuginis group]
MEQTTLGARQVDLADWRLLLGALRSWFAAESFAAAAAFVAAVGRCAEEAGHHPDVDLRAGHARFALRSHDAGGVTERDVRLAERISALAADHGLTPRPDRLQVLELALDTPVARVVSGFWEAVLTGETATGEAANGAAATGEAANGAAATGAAGGGDVEPAAELPQLGFEKLWFQSTDSTAPDRQRFHLDVTVPPEEADRRVAAALDAGGRVVDDSHAPAFVVLADPDGNRVCVCTELGRD